MRWMREEYEPKERLETIAGRLFSTRPRAEVVLRPYRKNIAQHVDIHFWSQLEHVDLYRFFPEAKAGQSCFVTFDISSCTEDQGNIKISNDVDVYLDNKLLYQRHSSEEEYVHLPISVGPVPQRVEIRCYCQEEKFAFDYLLSSKVYPFMWATDYLLHIKRTLPMEEYRKEEGIAVSGLYDADEQPQKPHTYVFPQSSEACIKKDFYKVYPQAKGFVGYAYAQAEEGGELILRNDSPMKVFVNGKAVVTAQEEAENRILLKKGDTLLVKSLRTEAAWGFSCDDSLLGRSVVQSDRNYGDRWILLGDFGKEKALEIAYGPEIELSFERLYRNCEGKDIFWRLADGSYVRPYLDSFFFGQWYYALMLGHWGILKAAKALDRAEWQSYFTDSIGILGKWFAYMKYDYEQLGVVTPFLQRSLVLDHLDPLGTMGMNLAELYLMTGDPQVKNTVYELRDALYQYVPRMENGIINRITTMWSDDLFMGVPFLVRLGNIFGDSKYYQDAFTQISEYYKKMFIEEEQIFSHIFYVEDYQKSNVPWGRGNGWVAVAMCEYLDHVPQEDENREEVIRMYRTFIKGVCALQDASGMWHQVLNQPSTYEETSCTAMFLYSMLRGVRLGILEEEEAAPVICKAFHALCSQCVDEKGNTSGVCKGSGCSRDWQNYNRLGTVNNDDHGTGIILAAFSEYLLWKQELCE